MCRVLFCSNPDAFGVDDTEKDPIFDTLKSITQLPPSPSKDADRQDASAIRPAESLAIEEASKKSPIVGTSE